MKFRILAIASILLVIACKKKETATPVAPACVAGSGGNLTIVTFLQHHGKTIPSTTTHLDTVFVKYNTQELPANHVYDTFFVGEAGEDHVHLMGLKCGNYFIYGAGFDSTINKRVVGGIPFSTSKTSGEVDLNVPVTE